VLEVKALSWFS